MFEEDDDYKLQTDCIMNKLRVFKTADAFIEQVVYKDDKTMSKLKRQKASSGVIATIEQKFELAEELCAPQIMFGKWFDELYGEDPIKESTNSTDSFNSKESEDDIEDLQEDYCQRKYLVDKHFIDVNIYNVTVNPSNIDVTKFKCDKFWFEPAEEYIIALKDEFVTALDSPSSTSIRCFSNTIRNGFYAETLLKVWMLSEIQITKKQLELERNSFISFMTNLYADVIKCQK